MSTSKRSLGRSGIDIAPMVFGGNVFGWTADEKRSLELLDRFVERGFNAIDTADSYSMWAPGLNGGESERLIGEWLARRGRRDDIVLMSKVGMLPAREGLSAATIEGAIDDSLQRLNTDYLDVYFAHIDDESVPLAETLGAFSRLIQAGKVRAIGASNYSPERLAEALNIAKEENLPRYEVIQPLYNLYDRNDFEGKLADVAKQNDLGVVSYFSLASGFLTGKYAKLEDLKGSSRAAFMEKYFDERGQRLLNELTAVAEELGVKPAQVALAWLIARPGVTAPIASATSLTQLEEIIGAVDVSLTEPVIARLDAAGQS